MMSSLAKRRALLALLAEACKAGSRLRPACALIGLSERTVQRWQRPAAGDDGDLRASGKRVASLPPNRLSDTERQAALALLNSEEFKDLPPSQIVPRLADQGRFVASESTLYRLLRGAGQLTHRRAERAPQPRSRPRALVACRPDQIYCWDISYLPTEVRGAYFYPSRSLGQISGKILQIDSKLPFSWLLLRREAYNRGEFSSTYAAVLNLGMALSAAAGSQ